MLSFENKNFLSLLSGADVEKIHGATLKILKNTGVHIGDEKTLDLLSESGCEVDFSKKVARFPEKVVMDCLDKSPSSFVLKARDEKKSCTVKSGGPFICAPSPGMQSVDLDTWEPKTPTRKEFYDYMRIIDALPNYDMHVGFPWGGFEGVPTCMALMESCAAKFRVSTKPNWEGTIKESFIYNTQMAQALNVDLWENTNPTSPLTFADETITQIKHFTKNDIPFSVCSGPVLGVSGPATIAGVVAMNNADILATNVIAQLNKAGSRLLAGSMIMAVDMRNAAPVFSNVANHLADSVFNQMWAYYGMPTLCNMGGWSNSKMIDYQAGYETTMGTTMMALSGGSVIAFGGGLTAELSAHPVKAIIDNDIIGMIKRNVQGIEVNDETLALDVIDEVGFAPTTYLGEEHTATMWRQDTYYPDLADMLDAEAWIKGGKKSIIDHGRQRMEEILSAHKICELSAGQEKMIEDILWEARNFYRANGSISDAEWDVYMRQINSPGYPYA